MSFDVAFAIALGALAFGASFFTLKAFMAFKGDVMQRMFGFLSAALLLVGVMAVVETLGYSLVSGYQSAPLTFPVMVASFVLLLMGLVPLVRWMDSSRQSELHRE